MFIDRFARQSLIFLVKYGISTQDRDVSEPSKRVKQAARAKSRSLRVRAIAGEQDHEGRGAFLPGVQPAALTKAAARLPNCVADRSTAEH